MVSPSTTVTTAPVSSYGSSRVSIGRGAGGGRRRSGRWPQARPHDEGGDDQDQAEGAIRLAAPHVRGLRGLAPGVFTRPRASSAWRVSAKSTGSAVSIGCSSLGRRQPLLRTSLFGRFPLDPLFQDLQSMEHRQPQHSCL